MLKLVTFLAIVVLACAQTDDTIVPGAKGKNVVLNVLEKIETNCVFDKDKQMLRIIAQAESDNGQTGTSNGGIWRVPFSVFQLTKTSSNLYAFTSRFPSVFDVNWATTEYSDLSKPLYSALASRLAIALQQSEKPPSFSYSLDGKLPWSVSEQIAIWKTAYQKSDSISLLQTSYNAAIQAIKQSSCPNTADIVFVLDSSGSIGNSHFELMRSFVQDVIRNFDVGPDATQFGIVPYSDNVETLIKLNQYHDKNSLINAVQRIPYSRGGTGTMYALQALYTTMFRSENGARGGSPKMAVVLTDGQSNVPDTVSATSQANLIHTKYNITMLSVGINPQIGSGYASELINIASKPTCMNLYQLRQFQDLAQAFAFEIKERICAEPASVVLQPLWTDPFTGEVVLPPPINVTLEQNGYWSACINVLAGVHSTITIKVKQGTLKIYFSFTIRKPISANNHFSRSVNRGSQPEALSITPSMLRKYKAPINNNMARLCMGFENKVSKVKAFEMELAKALPLQFEFNAIQGVYPKCGTDVILAPYESAEYAGPGYFDGTALGYPAGLRCRWNLPKLDYHYYVIEFPFLKLPAGDLLQVSNKEADLCQFTDHIEIISRNKDSRFGKSKLFCGLGQTKNSNILHFEISDSANVIFTSAKDAEPEYGFNMKITVLPDVMKQQLAS